MYTKKVMEHFMHPRNVGEINDADGIGEVGNLQCGDLMKIFIKIKDNKIDDIKFKTFGCIPRGEEIVKNSNGWEDISNIDKGFKVINSEGNSTTVVETYKREYNKSIFKIIPFVSPYNSFSITGEHPVLCIKRRWIKGARFSNKNCKWLQLRDKGRLLSTKPEYIKAKDLEVSDYLVFVVNKEIKDNEAFNEDIMRLLGYYLSEGYITANESIVNFSFNKNEKDAIEEVNSLVYRIINKKTSQRTRQNVTEVYVCSRKLVRFLYNLAGKGAKNKKLSEDIMLLPFKKQWEMLDTYIIGDGNKYRRRPHNSETYRITTVSKNLAIQVQEILARGGIYASIRKRFITGCKIDGRALKDSTSYIISFKIDNEHKFVHNKDNYFLVPIKKIEKKDFKGYVYNLSVLGKPNSYLVKGFAVHNCGAAIASSDALCELAKGKTVEEAKKITNRDIVNFLGGEMPEIKLHCSILGMQALRKAIEDYEKRTNSKL